MKREIRSLEVGMKKVNGDIIFAKCSCPACESGYCNHIMALLFETADYSLHQLILIPEENACTSMARRWGLLSANSSAKQPVMDIAIRKNPNSKKGITCTLHNPRVSGTNTDNSLTNRLEVLKQHFVSKSNLTGIAAANPSQRNCSIYNESHYGNYDISSTLANHLRVFDESLEFLANLEPADDSPVICDGEIIFPEIPAYDINKDFWSCIYTGDSNKETFLNSLIITFQDCVEIEKIQETRLIAPNGLSYVSLALLLVNVIEFSYVRGILKPYVHKLSILVTEDLPAKVKEALNHGKNFELRARERYIDVMRLKLRHFVLVRETGLVIQPSLFWFFSRWTCCIQNQ